MKYAKEEVNKIANKLDRSKFTSDENEALKRIVSDYNHVFSIAVKYQDYVKRKNAEWAKEMNQNHKLLVANEKLTKTNEAMKEEIKYMKKYISEQNKKIEELSKQNKLYEKLINAEDKKES